MALILYTLQLAKDLVGAIREDAGNLAGAVYEDVVLPKLCPPKSKPRYDDKWVVVPSPDATNKSLWEFVPLPDVELAPMSNFDGEWVDVPSPNATN